VTTKNTVARTKLTGADHHLFALLFAMNGGCKGYDATHLTRFRDEARMILASPHAFDLGANTVSVTDCILKVDRMEHRSWTRIGSR